MMSWLEKYFFLDQKLNHEISKQKSDSSIRYRKIMSILIPFLIVHVIWWTYMITYNKFNLFIGDIGDQDNPRYLMTITSVFASLIAGATCEGGAAVAFPVLTLVLNVAPVDAINLSFMIQSVGMTSASFAILYMGVKIEYKSLLYCGIGGAIGVIIGITYIAPTLSPIYNKMYFACVWFSFAISLYWLNKYHDRKVYDTISDWDKGILYSYPPSEYTRPLSLTASNSCASFSISNLIPPASNTTSTTSSSSSSSPFQQLSLHFNWKAGALFFVGILGGIFTSMSGSGLDICSFSVLTLLFRVSERIATPTSVLLMASNSIIAFLWKQFITQDVDQLTWDLWLCCVPVVVVGAPIGAIISSHFHRLTLAWLVYILDTAQLLGALIILQPWTSKHTSSPILLSLSSLLLMCLGLSYFSILAYYGQKLLNNISDCDDNASDINSLDDSIISPLADSTSNASFLHRVKSRNGGG